MNDIERMALIQQLEGNAVCYELLGEKDLPRLLRRAASALAPSGGCVLIPVRTLKESRDFVEDALRFRGGDRRLLNDLNRCMEIGS